MNELQIFNNPEFGQIRVIEIDGEPWMVGKDVAAALGYSAERNAIAAHVDEEDRLTHQISAAGQMRSVTLINESGLYSLVLSSKLPGAKKFRRWVTAEVLPSIRKTGGYEIPNMSKELQAIFALDKRTMQQEERITALEKNMVVDYDQQCTLRIQVNAVVTKALGGKNSPAYRDKSIRGRIYSECNHDIQNWFCVNSRNNIPRKRFEEAVEYIRSWRPSTNLSMTIRQTNEQIAL